MNRKDFLLLRSFVVVAAMLVTLCTQAQQKVEVRDYCTIFQKDTTYYIDTVVPDENGNISFDIGSLIVITEYFPIDIIRDFTDWPAAANHLCSYRGHDHIVDVRTLNMIDGVAHYGPIYSTTVYMPAEDIGSLILSSAEYFWDDDPGFGRATPIALPEAEGELTDDALVPDDLADGNHLFGLRLRSNVGWGPTLFFNVTVPERGDTDGDGEITAEDMTALLNILLGNDDAEPHQYDHATADVNRDRRISIADLTKLVNMILESQSQ